MSGVIIFPQTFPAYHQKAGLPTYFIEKFLNSIYQSSFVEWQKIDSPIFSALNHKIFHTKHHIIKPGNEIWNVGDRFLPCYLEINTYANKQIVISDEVEIKQVFSFKKI